MKFYIRFVNNVDKVFFKKQQNANDDNNSFVFKMFAQSQVLSRNAYFSNFIECDNRSQHILIMFMRTANQNPMTIRADGIFTFLLNLALFLSVISLSHKINPLKY